MSWRWFLKIEDEATTCKPSPASHYLCSHRRRVGLASSEKCTRMPKVTAASMVPPSGTLKMQSKYDPGTRLAALGVKRET